jgi:hypothetical protein
MRRSSETPLRYNVGVTNEVNGYIRRLSAESRYEDENGFHFHLPLPQKDWATFCFNTAGGPKLSARSIARTETIVGAKEKVCDV